MSSVKVHPVVRRGKATTAHECTVCDQRHRVPGCPRLGVSFIVEARVDGQLIWRRQALDQPEARELAYESEQEAEHPGFEAHVVVVMRGEKMGIREYSGRGE